MTNKRSLAVLLVALMSFFGLAVPATAAPAHAASATTDAVATSHGFAAGQSVCKTIPYAPPATGTVPFTTLPFWQAQARNSLVATQGWITSPDEEQFVDGPGEHRAIDFEFHNSPNKGFNLLVVLPNDACVYSSYQAFDCDNIVDGKRVGCGAGLFTEAITDTGWVIQVAHYDWINPKIPFLTTEPDGPNAWHPSGVVSKSSAQLKPLGVRMKAGEILGLMGETGITFGYYDDFRIVGNRGIVIPRTPEQREQLPNWEEGFAQAHVAYYGGRAEGGPRQRNTDPFGWYAQISATADPYNKPGQPGQFNIKPGNSLYLTHSNGQVRYALAG